MFLPFLQHFADACTGKTFFGIPPWYAYLSKDVSTQTYSSGASTYHVCNISIQLTQNGHLDFSVVLLIGLGVLDILLYLAGLVAVGFVIYGGIQYVTSQGEPDKTKRAQGTILNAVIGLAITVISASAVAFIGNRLGSS